MRRAGEEVLVITFGGLDEVSCVTSLHVFALPGNVQALQRCLLLIRFVVPGNYAASHLWESIAGLFSRTSPLPPPRSASSSCFPSFVTLNEFINQWRFFVWSLSTNLQFQEWRSDIQAGCVPLSPRDALLRTPLSVHLALPKGWLRDHNT